MTNIANLARKPYLWMMRSHPATASLAYIPQAIRRGLKLTVRRGHVEIGRGHDAIRLAHRHQFYLPGIMDEFEFYHSAVEPVRMDGKNVVDYSTPRFHWVRGFEKHSIIIPALAEPLSTVRQYLSFADLSPGAVAFDLGAYSGLTSILFDRAVGPRGRVIAVDADSGNVACIRENLALHQRLSGRTPDLLHAAVWGEDGALEFSAEGNMGSSAMDIVGAGRGRAVKVQALTLSSIAERYAVDRVDFIKCDIEGAEAVIFDQPRFFERYRPKMIVEIHSVGGELTGKRVCDALKPYGYVCRETPQIGSRLPLLECLP